MARFGFMLMIGVKFIFSNLENNTCSVLPVLQLFSLTNNEVTVEYQIKVTFFNIFPFSSRFSQRFLTKRIFRIAGYAFLAYYIQITCRDHLYVFDLYTGTIYLNIFL